jgi:hypothetical protein
MEIFKVFDEHNVEIKYKEALKRQEDNLFKYQQMAS